MGAKQTEGEGDVQQQCVVGGGRLQVRVPGGGVQAQGGEVMGDGGGGVGGANEGGEGHVEGPGDGVHAQGGEVMG